MGAPTRPTIRASVAGMIRMASPFSATGGKLFDKHKPYKKHGGKKRLAYMTAMLEAIQKGQKKAAKG